jgi:hypothetical protein
MRVESLYFLVFCPLLCQAALDIEVIILNDTFYNSTKFIESVSEFNPISIINGTEIPLLLSRPEVKINGFMAVLCVNGTCYKEEDLPPPPTPSPPPPPVVSPTPQSDSDIIVIAVVVSVVAVMILGVMLWCLTRRKRSSLNTQFQRVVIRESIVLPPHLAMHSVKTGSKHTRGLV